MPFSDDFCKVFKEGNAIKKAVSFGLVIPNDLSAELIRA